MIASLVTTIRRRAAGIDERTERPDASGVVEQRLARDASLPVRTTPAVECDGGGVVDYRRFDAALSTWKAAFDSAQPSPHLVIDGFLSVAAAGEACERFPASAF